MRTIRILKITIAPILMLLLLGACSKKPLIEQNSIEVRSSEAVSIEAAGGYERYSWRQISGTAVDIEDAKSRVLRFIAPDVTEKEVLLFELRVYTGNIELREEARVAVLPLKSGMDTEDGNGTKKSDENGTDREDSATDTDKESGTSPIQSLTLSIADTTLNKDHNTTLTIEAKYSDGTTKPVTESIEWIVTPKGAVKIEGGTITALKDTDVTIQAGYRGRLSNPVTLHIYWEVDGHRLPPEPDPKINNATLLGIDSNKNGVRDDVERWIYETYKKKHPIHIDIAMQEARADRLILEKQPKTKAEAIEIHDEVNKAIDCQAYYQFSAKYFNEPILIKENITDEYFRSKIYFNTKERMNVYIQYDTLLSGDSYTLPSDQERKAACDFNTSKYDKPFYKR